MLNENNIAPLTHPAVESGQGCSDRTCGRRQRRSAVISDVVCQLRTFAFQTCQQHGKAASVLLHNLQEPGLFEP